MIFKSTRKLVKIILPAKRTVSKYVEREEYETNFLILSNTLNSFIKEQKNFNEDVQEFIKEQKSFNRKQENFNRKQEGFNRKVDARLREFKNGFGSSFESFNKQWLFQVFESVTKGKSLNQRSIHRGFCFPTPERDVIPNLSTVEIDLFCSDPLVIGECTTFVGAKEMAKVDRFIKISQKVQSLYSDSKLNAYFMTHGIDTGIESEVREKLLKSGIKLIISLKYCK